MVVLEKMFARMSFDNDHCMCDSPVMEDVTGNAETSAHHRRHHGGWHGWRHHHHGYPRHHHDDWHAYHHGNWHHQRDFNRCNDAEFHHYGQHHRFGHHGHPVFEVPHHQTKCHPDQCPKFAKDGAPKHCPKADRFYKGGPWFLSEEYKKGFMDGVHSMPGGQGDSCPLQKKSFGRFMANMSEDEKKKWAEKLLQSHPEKKFCGKFKKTEKIATESEKKSVDSEAPSTSKD